eukprot:c20732_g1_i1.p1 GENE.c20732_g1_i1~~c20732_g1_i1.p1  ORF type:complete len:882 (-),score=189.95 c20732_g1_i1:37-2382(-)
MSGGWVSLRNVEDDGAANKVEIAHQVATALQGLHQRNFIFGNVCLSSVVCSSGRASLVGFDAAYVDGKGSHKFKSGILPPEMFTLLSAEEAKQYATYLAGQKVNALRYLNEISPRRIASLQHATLAGLDVAGHLEAGSSVAVKVALPESSNGTTPTLPFELVPVSPALDVWGFGLFLFELMTGKALLSTNTRYDLNRLDEAVNCRARITAELVELNSRNAELKDLLNRILATRGSLRLTTMTQVLEHPFFSLKSPMITAGGAVDNTGPTSTSKTTDSKIARITKEVTELNIEFLEQITLVSKLALRTIVPHSTGPLLFALLPCKLSRDAMDVRDVARTVGWVEALVTTVNVTNNALLEHDRIAIDREVTALCNASVHKTTFLYLIDEFTGKPVQDEEGTFPIRLPNPKSFVREHFGLLRASLVASYVINKALGPARMHGVPVSEFRPESVTLATNTLSEALDLCSPVNFAFLQAATQGGFWQESIALQLCNSAIQALTQTLTEQDTRLEFANLRRFALGRSPLVIWTDKIFFDRLEAKSPATAAAPNALAPFQEIADFVLKSSDSLEFNHFVDLIGILATESVTTDCIKKHSRVPYWLRLKLPYRTIYLKLLEADADELFQGFQQFFATSKARMAGHSWRAISDAMLGTKQASPLALRDPLMALHTWLAAQQGDASQIATLNHFVRCVEMLAKNPTQATIGTIVKQVAEFHSGTRYEALWVECQDRLSTTSDAVDVALKSYKEELATEVDTDWVVRLRKAVSAAGAVALWGSPVQSSEANT